MGENEGEEGFLTIPKDLSENLRINLMRMGDCTLRQREIILKDNIQLIASNLGWSLKEWKEKMPKKRSIGEVKKEVMKSLGLKKRIERDIDLYQFIGRIEDFRLEEYLEKLEELHYEVLIEGMEKNIFDLGSAYVDKGLEV